MHPKLFNGLTNLKIIDFRSNKIEIIHKNTFNSFTIFQKSNTKVYLDDKIKELHPILFNLFNLFNRLVR
jgi:hypothetical protein